jgi:hypothetical protein
MSPGSAFIDNIVEFLDEGLVCELCGARESKPVRTCRACRRLYEGSLSICEDNETGRLSLTDDGALSFEGEE